MTHIGHLAFGSCKLLPVHDIVVLGIDFTEHGTEAGATRYILPGPYSYTKVVMSGIIPTGSIPGFWASIIIEPPNKF